MEPSSMRRKLPWKWIVKALCFLLLLGLVLQAATDLILPKDYALTSLWPASSNIEGLYGLKRDSLDVLFLGSSKVYTAFIPQVLYEEGGLRSYNLGTDLQSGLLSYYWLREVLRFQKPQAVVLEINDFFPVYEYLALNAPEPMIRKSVDRMRWSRVKAEAVLDICRRDSEQSWLSYVFPHIRFHERWKSLNEDDFRLGTLRKHNELMGFSALLGASGIDDYRPFRTQKETEPADFAPVMQEYLDRIVSLCREADIPLVLTCVPDTRATAARWSRVNAYAKEHGLDYLDYNEETLYERLGYDFAADNADYEHPGLSGAQKLSRHLTEYLKNELALSGQPDTQWEAGKSRYEELQRDLSLVRETDPAAYLRCLTEPRYTVFLMAGEEWTEPLSEETLSAWRESAAACGLPTEGAFCAVLDGGCCTLAKAEAGEYRGSFRGGRGLYRIRTAEEMSLRLDNTDYSPAGNGLFCLVYDTQRRMVLDRVSIGAELTHEA